jgi:hypothetical protein
MSFISTDSITGASGRATPRPETPEPGAQQGRRNAQSSGVQLLDSDGSISEKVSRYSQIGLPFAYVDDITLFVCLLNTA